MIILIMNFKMLFVWFCDFKRLINSPLPIYQQFMNVVTNMTTIKLRSVEFPI